ncbi:LysR family transcriptional regulator [Olsenella sp. HMSC062G07]|uniref:LysR family transcriptional regulator n=1 Tax=Olsenella sp. HMSC062G07 TaxID=1739330 RepID=UPI0008A4F44F|nr:LysR family transcriptional regulator [Olsenella sp. HMSC062G07]OFK23566.1 LysR family transcriptional regulator [Olsenella sp. HMSC062G07]
MRLQQLRYIIAIAENGAINAVAHGMFVSQSSLSVAVRDLEQELGIRIFDRSSRGIALTSDGAEFLGYARQVVEQADLLMSRYSRGGSPQRALSVSSQHYAFAVQAFIDFVSAHESRSCQFTLRETRTASIIDDVRSFRSDLGILYLATSTERALRRRLDESNLVFTSLFRAKPHVFVRDGHPLAARGTVRVKDLAEFPRYTFEQGPESSLYFSEEPLSTLPHDRQIVASDRATMTSLLKGYDGYLISTGVRSDEMYSGITSVPLETDEVMNVGYVVHGQRRPSALAEEYIARLSERIVSFEGSSPIVPSRRLRRVEDTKDGPDA